MRRNLKDETITVLESHGFTTYNNLFVTDGIKTMTFSDFARIAKNINYDSGYGNAEINMALKVVGPNWWLERHEYDGAEWWEFKTMPELPREVGIVRFMSGMDYDF